MTLFEEKRAADISLTEVIDGIYGFFPDIEEPDIRFFYHGTYNVFEVKNQFIFRIPDKVFRNHMGVKLIQNELKMLHHIQKYVSVVIPQPIYLSIDPDCPLMGYKKIEGIPLSKCYYSTSNNEKIKIAKEVSKFLSELHSDELFKDAISKGIVETPFLCEIYRENWEKYFEKIQMTIFKSMNSTQKRWITNLFNSFLNEKKNFKFKYTIIHGDFDISNILVDDKTFEITGIVDFEESRIYDPAADFLFYEEGDLFLNELLSNYKGLLETNFKKRMKFLYGRSSLGYIEFGVENNLPNMIEAGFQKLKIAMSKFPL